MTKQVLFAKCFTAALVVASVGACLPKDAFVSDQIRVSPEEFAAVKNVLMRQRATCFSVDHVRPISGSQTAFRVVCDGGTQKYDMVQRVNGSWAVQYAD